MTWIIKKVQFVSVGILLEDNSKVKGIVSVPKGNADTSEPSRGFFQSNSIASWTILGLDDGFFVVWWYLSLRKDLIFLIKKSDRKLFIFFRDFDPTFPEHLFPVI